MVHTNDEIEAGDTIFNTPSTAKCMYGLFSAVWHGPATLKFNAYESIKKKKKKGLIELSAWVKYYQNTLEKPPSSLMWVCTKQRQTQELTIVEMEINRLNNTN